MSSRNFPEPPPSESSAAVYFPRVNPRASNVHSLVGSSDPASSLLSVAWISLTLLLPRPFPPAFGIPTIWACLSSELWIAIGDGLVPFQLDLGFHPSLPLLPRPFLPALLGGFDKLPKVLGDLINLPATLGGWLWHSADLGPWLDDVCNWFDCLLFRPVLDFE